MLRIRRVVAVVQECFCSMHSREPSGHMATCRVRCIWNLWEDVIHCSEGTKAICISFELHLNENEHSFIISNWSLMEVVKLEKSGLRCQN